MSDLEPIGFHAHDHSSCIQTALDAVQIQCAEQKLQLTAVRKRVLEILLSEHRAMGAYDILAVLGKEGLGSQPPVVYRALDFLVSHGFAHKIERMNAYVACALAGGCSEPVFLICRACDGVAEVSAEHSVVGLDDITGSADFRMESVAIEVKGMCPTCVQKDSP